MPTPALANCFARRGAPEPLGPVRTAIHPGGSAVARAVSISGIPRIRPSSCPITDPPAATSIVSSTTRFSIVSTELASSSLTSRTTVSTWRLFSMLRRMWKNSVRSSGGLWMARELTESITTIARGCGFLRRRYSTRSMIASSARGLSM